MAVPPESTEASLRQLLAAHGRHRWPQLTTVTTRYRGAFANVSAPLPGGTTTQPLCRLRYAGSAPHRGFAAYPASRGDYQDSVLPPGYPTGTPAEALDCACDLYLQDRIVWRQLHTN
jgi:hypothetical protein